MRNLLAIQTLGLLLCIAMVAEIPMSYEDEVTIELETEKEQEEQSESEKEKTTGGQKISKEQDLQISMDAFTSRHVEDEWNSPSIDRFTPPPEGC